MIQIESFRKQLASELIEEKRYGKAKKLVDDFFIHTKRKFWISINLV